MNHANLCHRQRAAVGPLGRRRCSDNAAADAPQHTSWTAEDQALSPAPYTHGAVPPLLGDDPRQHRRFVNRGIGYRLWGRDVDEDGDGPDKPDQELLLIALRGIMHMESFRQLGLDTYSLPRRSDSATSPSV